MIKIVTNGYTKVTC